MIFKKLTLFIFALILMLLGAVPSFAEESYLKGAEEPPEVTGTSIILMDAGNGKILYEKDAYKKRDPASVTKILNCLVCLDKLDLDRKVTVDIDPTDEGSIMNLKKGETLKVRDIIYGMMLWSANDGAEYLAHLAGEGDTDSFCEMMNAKAKEFGAKDTKYVNPNGLNGSAVNNVTTAYDIAVTVREGMKDKRFREIVGTDEYVIYATNKSKKRSLTNSNMCLWNDMIRAAADGEKEALDKYTEEYESDPYYYTGDDEAANRAAAKKHAKLIASLMYKPCIGVKTGYSSTAGDCFAGFAKKGNTEIIAVVLNAPHTKDKFQDAKKLWTYAYDNFKTYTAQTKDDFDYEMKVKWGELREVKLGIDEDLKVTALKKDKPAETVTVEVELNEEKPTCPIKKGEIVGKLVAYDGGKAVSSEDLISLETSGRGGPLSHIGFADEDRYQFFILVGLFIALVIIIIRAHRAKKRRMKRRQRRRAAR